MLFLFKKGRGNNPTIKKKIPIIFSNHPDGFVK